MADRAVLGITMGDPAGVGPEILVKALAEEGIHDRCSPVVFGAAHALQRAVDLTGVSMTVCKIDCPANAANQAGRIDVIEPVTIAADEYDIGQISAVCGRAAVGYFEAAIHSTETGNLQGVVTCPINKEAVHEAGFIGDIGHQEILARLTGAKLTATMLLTRGLRVAHLSTHKSLAEAVAYVKTPAIVDKLQLTHDCLVKWGLKNPRIAVSALNPHGGEGGMLGREEIEEIVPAVRQAQDRGLSVTGPFPADSVFYRAIAGEFDVVLALYHDQGHIAIKVHNFDESVTATMGIPFVRTSVDHGTAFDIAGKNLANHTSLVRAIDTAIAMINGTYGS